jgi:peptide/nickel transport system substrate-binding protein
MKSIRPLIFGVLFALVAAGCTPGTTDRSTSPTSIPVGRGGTLRALALGPLVQSLDPQLSYNGDDWEVFRCCLARTLLSYSGRPADEGGAVLRPDLAATLPTVSPDHLTWEFRLKTGLHYGPPLERLPIVAGDFVRALEREADPKISAPYAFYYSVIRGFDDFAEGRAGNIAGITAPNNHTLIFQLNEPTGDFGYRLALSAAAPLPPNPTDPSATLGVAQGHQGGDFGRFLVSSGPYMVEGSQHLDFAKPPSQQVPASGYSPAVFAPKLKPGSLSLVRNPSWDPGTDDLRPAYPDRIEIALGSGKVCLGKKCLPSPEAAVVRKAQWDLTFDFNAITQSINRYRTNPQFRNQVHTADDAAAIFIGMNLAVPPFNDLAVRKAVYLAIDKAALFRMVGSIPGAGYYPFHGKPARHLVPDPLEGNLLLSSHPSWAPDRFGSDPSAARAEMRRSRYDRNGDGKCDSPVCSGIKLLVNSQLFRTSMKPLLERNLLQIGLNVTVESLDGPSAEQRERDPSKHVAMFLDLWGADYPNGAAYFPPLFSGSVIGEGQAFNASLVGARPGQLRKWGYNVKRVPGVDDRIAECQKNIGQVQVQCWAQLDHYMMQSVVPWVPFFFTRHTYLTSSRVTHYSYDQWANLPALDQIALKPRSR